MWNDPYIGEIRMFAGTYAPEGWADCDGQVLPISQNSFLFNVIGTTYGGDGVKTFALPDLQGRVPVAVGTGPHGGSTFAPGERGGTNRVTLTVDELPVHTHALVATDDSGIYESPENRVLAWGSDVKLFAEGPPTTSLDPRTVESVGYPGWTQPHDNEMPYLAIRFAISLGGVYPSPE